MMYNRTIVVPPIFPPSIVKGMVSTLSDKYKSFATYIEEALVDGPSNCVSSWGTHGFRWMLLWTALEEGFSPSVYNCTEDHQTIGFGFLTDTGQLPPPDYFASKLLSFEKKIIQSGWINDVEKQAYCYPILILMSYQLGISGTSKFEKVIARMNSGDRVGAVSEMRDSNWFKQTPRRVERLTDLVWSETQLFPTMKEQLMGRLNLIYNG